MQKTRKRQHHLFPDKKERQQHHNAGSNPHLPVKHSILQALHALFELSVALQQKLIVLLDALFLAMRSITEWKRIALTTSAHIVRFLFGNIDFEWFESCSLNQVEILYATRHTTAETEIWVRGTLLATLAVVVGTGLQLQGVGRWFGEESCLRD